MANTPLFKPSDLNLKVNFTTVKTGISPINGSPTKQPVILFTKWGAFRRRTITQNYSVVGTSLADTLVIGVKHDERINKTLGITVKGVNYQILDISPDDSNNYLTYDLITVKKVVK
ncbi:phage head closure protein [Leuconostoc citreum]|uniref:phage head closure protein n=1 Tax=Leuconostoc citreum TaxID=33964 RepID=UPI000BFEFFB7|nr:phage head closure protein [Leuconostoc citreum]